MHLSDYGTIPRFTFKKEGKKGPKIKGYYLQASSSIRAPL